MQLYFEILDQDLYNSSSCQFLWNHSCMQSISYYRSNKLSRIIVQVIYNAIELFNSLVSNMNKITINNKCSFRSVINIAEPCMYFNSGYAAF